MPYEPAALGHQAAEAVTEALDHLRKAQSRLAVADDALVAEERQHTPAISPGNQAKLVTYAEIMCELDRVRKALGE